MIKKLLPQKIDFKKNVSILLALKKIFQNCYYKNDITKMYLLAHYYHLK